MSAFFGFLAAITGVFSLLIFIRIILSWFSAIAPGKLITILNRITDPYINWWRTRFKLRFGPLDFSVIVAIVALHLLQRIFQMLSATVQFSLGGILSIILFSIWSILSFIAGFFLVILVLRLIAYITNRNTYSPFWAMIVSVSSPILFHFNRILNVNNKGGYFNIIIISCLILLVIIIGGRFIVITLAAFLANLPL